ncbi:MAG: DNA repair protein RadC [Pseudomonadota bacterium]
MSIKDWPESERPREKLFNRGATALSDAELLALFLRSGSRDGDAVSIARTLLRAYGGLPGVLEAPRPVLTQIPGVGQVTYANLQGALELAQRYTLTELKKSSVFHAPHDAKRFVLSKMRGYQREVFACLFLDTRHRLLAYRELFFGTLNAAPVYPREILKMVIKENAAAVILAHNHPSGEAETSAADLSITVKIQQVLDLIDVAVLDHLIVGHASGIISLAERGELGSPAAVG